MTNVENTGKDARLVFGADGCGVTLLSQSERCLREGFNCIFVQELLETCQRVALPLHLA